MQYSFTCFGHRNVLCQHRNTLEFTKDAQLTLRGDCIVGVRADYDFEKLKQFIQIVGEKKTYAQVQVDGVTEQFSFFLNASFSDEHEMVIRKTGFLDSRTLGILASKASKDFDRVLVQKLQKSTAKAEILFTIGSD